MLLGCGAESFQFGTKPGIIMKGMRTLIQMLLLSIEKNKQYLSHFVSVRMRNLPLAVSSHPQFTPSYPARIQKADQSFGEPKQSHGISSLITFPVKSGRAIHQIILPYTSIETMSILGIL